MTNGKQADSAKIGLKELVLRQAAVVRFSIPTAKEASDPWFGRIGLSIEKGTVKNCLLLAKGDGEKVVVALVIIRRRELEGFWYRWLVLTGK